MRKRNIYIPLYQRGKIVSKLVWTTRKVLTRVCLAMIEANILKVAFICNRNSIRGAGNAARYAFVDTRLCCNNYAIYIGS